MEVRRATGGEGVDLVLNSLPGAAVTRSLGVLRAYGRFLEIGKIDIYATRAYVAINRRAADQALRVLGSGRIKGRRFRVRRLS